VCSSCKQAATVDRAVIEHPPGAETLWDWVELPDPPTRWGWISTAYVLIGALPQLAGYGQQVDSGGNVETGGRPTTVSVVRVITHPAVFKVPGSKAVPH
jgi:hypothetical protein